MTARLHPATHALLRDALHRLGLAAALPFAEAVVHQVAHPLGAPALVRGSREAAGREGGVAAALLDALLAAASRDDHRVDAAADRLGADAALLAACYQNVDLLPTTGHPGADAVALMVGRAVERLAARSTA